MKSTRSKKSATEVKQGAASTLISQEMSANQGMCENISEVVVNEASPTADSVDQSLTDRVSETTTHTATSSKCQEIVLSGQENGTENETATNLNGQIGNQNPIHFTTKQMPSDAKGKGTIKSKKKSHTAAVNSKPRRSHKGTTKSPKKQISSRSQSTSGSENEGSSFKKKNTQETSKNPTENLTAKTRVPDETTQQKSPNLLPLASVPKVKKYAAKKSRPLSLRKTKSKKTPKMKQNTAKGKTTSLSKKKFKNPGTNQRNTVLSAPDDVSSPPKRIKLETFDASDSISTNLPQPAKQKTPKSQVNESSDGEEEDKKSKKHARIFKKTNRRARARKKSSARKVGVRRQKKAKAKRKKSPKRKKGRSLGKGKLKSKIGRQGKGRR